MNHRLHKLFLFLLILSGGAIINVAIAWGCALWSRPYVSWDSEVLLATFPPSQKNANYLRSAWPEEWVATDKNSYFKVALRRGEAHGLDLVTAELERCMYKRSKVTPSLLRLLQAGWPMKSLQCEAIATTDDISLDLLLNNNFPAIWDVLWVSPPQWRADIPAPEWLRAKPIILILPNRSMEGILQSRQETWPLPLAPIGIGFAINTIFYAVIVWMIFAMPFAIRRRRRITRGLCPACAYPTGESPFCTECGGAVTPKSDAA